MLYKELQKIVAAIEFYDNKEGWRAFVDELMKRQLTTLQKMSPLSGNQERNKAIQWTKTAVGAGWYSRLIKPLPVVVEIMAEVIQDRQGPAHTRAALAGALAYLVQSDDIIPDEANGGYGLVDDAIVLYYTYDRYLQDLAARVPEVESTIDNYTQEMEAVIKLGLRIFPKSGIPDLKRVLSTIAMGFYHLEEVPSYILEQMIEQVVQRPEENGTGKLLSRLAYHLDVRFQPYTQSIFSDPILAMLDAMEAEAGSAPGEVISEGYYY